MHVEISRPAALRGRRMSAALLAAAGTVAPASGAVRDWIGPNNSFFNVINSWSPAGVPNLNDTARFGVNGKSNENVWMPPSASVQDLHVADGMTLHLLLGSLYVQDDAVFTGRNQQGVTFFPSQIRVTAGGDPWDFWVGDRLTVEDGARIEMLGGVVQVDGLMELEADSVIAGHGTLRLRRDSGSIAGHVDGILDPDTDGMTIELSGSTGLDLDGINGNGIIALDGRTLSNPAAYDRLTITGDRLADAFDGLLEMVSGARLEMNLAEPWAAGPGSLITVTTPLPATQPARITGAEAELHGELTVFGEDAEMRFESDVVIEPSFVADLGPTTRLRMLGDIRIKGGTFTAGADAAVVLGGETVWSGESTFSGLVTQDGDARAGQATTINATVFDLDGGSGTTSWAFPTNTVINADWIERSSALNDFDGSMELGNGAGGRLELNLGSPGAVWRMQGSMEIVGNASTHHWRLGGSPVRFEGSLTATGKSIITADATFANGSSTHLPGAASVQLDGTTVVHPGTAFTGAGELRNGFSGDILLHDGVSLWSVGLENRGELRVGTGPAGAVVGRFAQHTQGTWRVQISGASAVTEHDRLAVMGAATLAGELAVELLDAGGGVFIPEVGDEFTILTAPGGIGGAFSSVPASQAGGATVHWEVVYAPFAVILRAAEVDACLADFDGDGAVDVSDLIGFLSAFSAGDASADMDGSGVVGVADLLAYLGMFSDGC